MESVRNVIIVGDGPAGYTAAIYTARANLAPVVFEGGQYGGALMQTTAVEISPVSPTGSRAPNSWTPCKQAGRYGAELVAKDVSDVDLAGEIKSVTVDGRRWRARTVILAMGSAYRRLGLPGEDRLAGHGVSWCATCDGFFFRDQDIAVVGGGDSALEEATFLTRFAKTVTVVHRRDTLKASKIMQRRAFADPKIRFRWNTVVEDIVGADQVTGLEVRDAVTGQPSTRPATSCPGTGPPGPTCRESSPVEISSTTPTGRRSPRPAAAAVPPSTSNATSPSPPAPTDDAISRPSSGGEPCPRTAP